MLQNIYKLKTLLKLSLRLTFLDAVFYNVYYSNYIYALVVCRRRGMQNMLKEALKKRDYAQILAKAASILRKHMFCHEAYEFNGTIL